MYWDILDQDRVELLKKITEYVVIGEYYMAGGTALSLQLGLRESLDFDFFVPNKFTPHDLYHQLQDVASKDISAINVDENGTCDVIIDGVQVSFFAYPYRMIRPYVQSTDIRGLKMASVDDIAAMKAAAIGNRGAKKDFFDLYHILQRPGYDAETLVKGLYAKFGTNMNLSYIGMGLNYFEDAEAEILPKTYMNDNWTKIKDFFEKFQEDFFKYARNDLTQDRAINQPSLENKEATTRESAKHQERDSRQDINKDSR